MHLWSVLQFLCLLLSVLLYLLSYVIWTQGNTEIKQIQVTIYLFNSVLLLTLGILASNPLVVKSVQFVLLYPSLQYPSPDCTTHITPHHHTAHEACCWQVKQYTCCTSVLVRVKYVHSPWALQREHSVHYFWDYFSSSFLPEGVVLRSWNFAWAPNSQKKYDLVWGFHEHSTFATEVIKLE